MKVLRKVAMAISAFLDVQMPGAQPHHDAWNVDYWQFLPGTKHRHWGTGRGPSSADVSLAGEAGPSPISSNLCASGHAIAQRPASEQVERCHRNAACEDDAEHRIRSAPGLIRCARRCPNDDGRDLPRRTRVIGYGTFRCGVVTL